MRSGAPLVRGSPSRLLSLLIVQINPALVNSTQGCVLYVALTLELHDLGKVPSFHEENPAHPRVLFAACRLIVSRPHPLPDLSTIDLVDQMLLLSLRTACCLGLQPRTSLFLSVPWRHLALNRPLRQVAVKATGRSAAPDPKTLADMTRLLKRARTAIDELESIVESLQQIKEEDGLESAGTQDVPDSETQPKLVLQFDGGSRGKSEIAGCGMVAFDRESGKELWFSQYFIDHSVTNNVAEYTALIEGIKIAKQCGMRVRRTPVPLHSRFLSASSQLQEDHLPL